MLMRSCLAACLFLGSTLASADAPPVLASADLSGNSFELVFDQPMITWNTRSRGNGLVTTPEADCGWYWTNDTTLVCETWHGQGTPLRKATPYRVDIGEGLWSQSGAPFAPTSVTLVSSPPELEASAEAWEAGRPTIFLRSSQPLTAAAIRAVLDATFELEPIDYSLEPVPEDDAGYREGVSYRWVPAAWPDRPVRLRLSLREGLRSPLGPARGEADEALLTAGINLPFRLSATSCVSQYTRVVAGEKMTCDAGSDVLLLFSRRPSDAALERVGASLPKGLALAEDARDCNYQCFAHRTDNGAPAHAIRLSSTAAGQSLAFELPAGLEASDGGRLVGRTTVNLDFASWPPGFRIEPEVRVVLPGSESVSAVETRNLAKPVLWREFSIGRRLRQAKATLDARGTPEVFSQANAPEPAWGVLRHGGLSIGGADQGDAARATALPAFQLLVNQHGADLLAWATEWADASAVAGARVDVVELSSGGRQKVLASASTGPDGVAMLSLAGLTGKDDSLLMLRATQDRRVTILPLHGMTRMDLHPSAGDDNDQVPWQERPRRLATPHFGVTDRLLYRPGDKVHFRIWQRERRLNRLHRPEPGMKVQLALGQPSETTVRTWEAGTDAWGSVSGEVQLPANLRDGDYCIDEAQRLARSWSSVGACFEVRRFETQALWAKLSVPTTMQRPGDRVTLAAEAGYYSGGPAAGARLQVFGLLMPLDFTEAYPAYAGYRFVDPGVHGASEADPLAGTEVPAAVDVHGRAEIAFVVPETLEYDEDGGDDITLLALAQIKLNSSLMVGGEAGASSPTADLRIAAFEHYVGLRSEVDWQALDETPMLEAVVVGHDGVAQPGRSVEVRLETTDEESPVVLGRCTLVSGTPSPCEVTV
ncbi:MAG: MG2 domain-containing protein, partial [Pseudoxanthomonas sp.]|nr:MG2 domain-containing protein [Pseudoxanthomonas sp.]